MLRPCLSSQGHGTASPSRGALWATCPRSASSGYHTEFHEGCYQKHTNLRWWSVWNQTTFVMGEEKSGSNTLQKDDLLNCWTSSSDISGYHADFHEGCYQKHTNLSWWSVWNQTTFVTDKEESGSNTLQKDDLLNCWTSSSDISGYHADFHERHGTVRAWEGRGMGTACYVWIGLKIPVFEWNGYRVWSTVVW